MLTRTQPRNLDDLAVQVAIVRPGPDRRRRGESVRPAPRAAARGPELCAAGRPSAAGRAAGRHARRRPLPGPGARGRHRDGWLHARPGRPVPALDEPPPLARGDGAVSDQLHRRRGAQRRRGARRGHGVRQALRVLGVRLSEEPRLRVRGAGLSVGVAAPLLPGRVLRGAAQQPADGVLRAARAGR